MHIHFIIATIPVEFFQGGNGYGIQNKEYNIRNTGKVMGMTI